MFTRTFFSLFHSTQGDDATGMHAVTEIETEIEIETESEIESESEWENLELGGLRKWKKGMCS